MSTNVINIRSQVLILPGLGSSGSGHWQTLWEEKCPRCERVEQEEWNTPDLEGWIDALEKRMQLHDPLDVILVAHSAACALVAGWYRKYQTKVKGALLVAPADGESERFPKGASGFSPMPLSPLPFNSITVISTNDIYVTVERGTDFAKKWRSTIINIGDAGHINADSNLGIWEEGLNLLVQLDRGGYGSC